MNGLKVRGIVSTCLLVLLSQVFATSSVIARDERRPPPPRNGDSDDRRPPRPNDGDDNRPPRPEDGEDRKDGRSRYSIEQAISDNAQLHTIAFNGLAFITGNFGANTFIPPGKVADFFGFQYMRDIDVAGKGHNPMFLGRVAGNVLYILNDQQRNIFKAEAKNQATQLKKIALLRLPLIKAFTRELEGDIPAGCSGLSKETVIKYNCRDLCAGCVGQL